MALAACADPEGGGDGDAGAQDMRPTPDMLEPDAAEPDAAEPEPDAMDPDAAEPEPDAAEPEPDAAEPEPDAMEPEPDAAEPEPDAGCMPMDELCNGADDDCDGETDEGFELGGGCAVGVGACAAEGVVVCSADGEGIACDAEAGAPGDELCNGADDDCDGETDEDTGGSACETGLPGACAAGATACVAGEAQCVQAVEPSDEVCDGVDNDCDGEVDDVPGVGEACVAGAGACEAQGVVACGPDGPACDAAPSAPVDEICNGIDDDCDGEVDDVDGLGQPCTVGVGACAAPGVTACGPEGEICDGAPRAPSDEICDGQDNDCDGQTDELAECDPEICDNAVDDDGDGAVDCDDVDCAAFPECQAAFELCGNGLDDDGDGAIDCADVDCALDPLCVVPIEDCANEVDDDGDGAVDCEDDDCDGAPACRPPLELCDNGNDDNGDGQVDCADPQCAALPECLPDPEDCQNGVDDDGDGAVDCDDDACLAAPNCGLAEICDNGIDDDGDTEVDCFDVDCAAEPGCAPPPPEVCGNGLDDDDDGLVDCDDGDCQFDPDCVVPLEICDNGIDDDGDGGVDCADVDCAFFEGCIPDEICGNGGDDDRDGAIDCEDDDCADAPECIVDEATPIALPGGAIALEGELDGDSPTFARPDEACAAPEGGQRYQAFRVLNQTGAPQVLDIEAEWFVGDGFLLVYEAPFDPEDPLGGCVVGNDDDVVIARSAVRGQPIAAGQELVVVATTFDPGQDLGPYDITVTTRAAGEPEICDNGQDDDGDGFVDCDDLDCDGVRYCELIPIAAPGASIALGGRLNVDSPTYNRQTDGCGAVDRPDRRYQAFEIVNRTGADRLITATARWNQGDGFLFVYRAPFDPADPASNCLDGDDDFSGIADSQVAEVPIADGEVLVLVAATFDAGAAVGPFDLAVQTLADGPRVEICDNLRDDDGDGLADCDDPACAGFPACRVDAEDCLNGVDDDGDGAVDCADLDCAEVVQCVDEICDNGEDDDNDGALDCGDPECAAFPGCTVCPAVDFEGGVVPGYFGATGDAPWTVIDGAATSGAIDDSQVSGLTLQVEVGDGGRIQFAFRVDSEAIYDFLRLYVDGIEVDTWDGEIDWTTVGFDLAPGRHTIEWRYTKDVSQGRGEDRAQIDDIVLIGGVACPGDVLPVSIALPGGAITLDGQLDGASPVFDRPDEDCVGSSPGRRYRAFSVVNRTGADQTLDLLATWGVGDGFLLVYRGFDPADGEAGCLAGDDDIAVGDESASEVLGVPIADGEVLTVVATSFAAGADVGPFTIDVTTAVEPGGGTCEAPFPVVEGAYDGSTADVASALAGSCGGGGAPEVVHVLAGDGGVYCIDTEGSGFDTVLYVFEDLCDVLTEQACDDDTDGLANFASQVQLATVPGSDYFIVVDGYSDEFGAESGAYVLDIVSGACP